MQSLNGSLDRSAFLQSVENNNVKRMPESAISTNKPTCQKQDCENPSDSKCDFDTCITKGCGQNFCYSHLAIWEERVFRKNSESLNDMVLRQACHSCKRKHNKRKCCIPLSFFLCWVSFYLVFGLLGS